MSMLLYQIFVILFQDVIFVRVYRSKIKEKEKEEQNEKILGYFMSYLSNIFKVGSFLLVLVLVLVLFFFCIFIMLFSQDICRICYCEGDDESFLIIFCYCIGSFYFVYQICLQQWIKSFDMCCCEFCKYEFIMEIKLKLLRKWEKLQMMFSECRKIMCLVIFYIIVIICVVWFLYVFIDCIVEEIKQGQVIGILEWFFWIKLVVVVIGFIGGFFFMYV